MLTCNTQRQNPFDSIVSSTPLQFHTSDSLNITQSLSQTQTASYFETSESSQALSTRSRHIEGSLRADIFNVSFNDSFTVISGNGNVDFGTGARDWIDLSHISFYQVNLELASAIQGIVYNPGNGNRVFDSMTLSTGQRILFEGIEGINFAEGYVSLVENNIPNDPLFGQQWNLHMMGTQNAWRFTTGSTNVMIGVGDTGLSVDWSGFVHPDLGNTIWLGTQGIDDTSNNHGTSVQGIIAAQTNNGIGMSGINWNSQTFNIDVLGNERGDLDLDDAAQTMINQARSQGQQLVINLSLGRPESFNRNFHFEFEQVVQNNPDVLFVIAAGNDGDLGREGLSSPAILARSYSNVMAVGASWGTQDRSGQARNPGSRIQYSNWASQYGDGLTLMGPSEVIAPQWNGFSFDYATTFNGTSAAAPNVTGVASLVWSANSNLTSAQVKTILAQTSVDVGTVGYDKFTGSGFVNADAAVRRAIAIGLGFA